MSRCERPERCWWRARKELNPLDAGFESAALRMSYTPVPAGGIEPPRDGATTRCLPTWLSRRMLVAEAGIEPAAVGAYETPALPLSYSAMLELRCPFGFDQAARDQSPVPYQLGEGAKEWSHVRDSNPRHPI